MRWKAAVRGLALLGLSACVGDTEAPKENRSAPLSASEAEWFVSLGGGGRSGRFWQPDYRPSSGRPGIYEVTRYPYAPTTPEQSRAADDLLRRSLTVAEERGWFDYERGLADGFHNMRELDRLHFANDAHLRDGRMLDPERPEFLMYYDTSGGKKLAGFMYLADTQYGSGPQIGGPLTVWHYHIWDRPMCWSAGVPLASATGTCVEGVPADRSPEMIHVWFIEHPEGSFATTMGLTRDLIDQLAEDRYIQPEDL